MRDENRIREKLELALDSRQLVSLGIGALVSLGVVFVLGVMVGKQLPQQGKAAPRDLLSSLDQAADAGSVPLTFQQDLVKPAPGVAEARAVKPGDRPAPKLEAHPVQANADKPSSAPVAKVETPKADAIAIAPARSDDDALAPGMDKQLADAFSAAKKDPPQAASVAAPENGFTVQVAASQQKDDADAVIQKLRGSGLRPYLMDADIPGKGHWYRVRLGAFTTKADAQKYAQDLKRETGFTAFVTSAK